FGAGGGSRYGRLTSIARGRFGESPLAATVASANGGCSGTIVFERSTPLVSGAERRHAVISGAARADDSLGGEIWDDTEVVPPETGALNFRCQSIRPLSSVRWTAPTIASRILAGSRKRTSRFAG